MNKDINRELNSFRGFTLIELLAVIVVLAIIILIAVNAVLPQIENARRSSFAIEANAAIDSASGYFMAADLMGGSGNQGLPANEGDTSCVKIQTLIDEGYSELDEDYSGYVAVTKGSDNSSAGGNNQSNRYYYMIWIQQNGTRMINGYGYTGTAGSMENEDITADMVVDYDEDTFASSSGTKRLPQACIDLQ